MSQEITPNSNENKLVIFQNDKIRRVLHNDEWYYSIVDIVGAISESKNRRRYWSDLKRKLTKEGYNQLYENIVQLKMTASDGKKYDTDCADDKTIFRIIQSIPSPKAEPFKRWFAQLAKERIQEIENPELAAQRAREYYKSLGYDDDWIATRLQSVQVRGKLTDEWKERGVKEGIEYSILTAEISRATFGMSPSEYKQYKDLKRENLRDHMTDLELIFTMLGEASTRKQAEKDNARGFVENKKSAEKGGSSAGKALEAYEADTGEKVVTDKNYKHQIDKAKKEQKKLKKDK